MRSALVGSVESTQVTLEALVRYGVAPEVLCTLPREKSIRHSDFVDLQPVADRYGIRVLAAPNSNAPEVIAQLHQLQLDHIFVIGWSQICKPEFLAVARSGGIGYHPALLPQNRGRAVIPWTILQGLTRTGGTIFWMDEGVDSGDIIMQDAFDVAPDETARSLYDKHINLLRYMLDQTIPALKVGSATRVPQQHDQATWCAKRTPIDGLIDWKQSAQTVWTLIRAVGQPYPGAFSYWQNRKLVIWEADWIGEAPYWGLPGQVQGIDNEGVLVQCGNRKHIRIKSVEYEGSGAVSAKEVLKLHQKLGIDWVRIQKQIAEIGG